MFRDSLRHFCYILVYYTPLQHVFQMISVMNLDYFAKNKHDLREILTT